MVLLYRQPEELNIFSSCLGLIIALLFQEAVTPIGCIEENDGCGTFLIGEIMGSLSIWHWLIVLVIVTLVFGTKKLRNLGSDLGGAVKGFKEGMREDKDSAAPVDGSGQLIDNTSKGGARTNV